MGRSIAGRKTSELGSLSYVLRVSTCFSIMWAGRSSTRRSPGSDNTDASFCAGQRLATQRRIRHPEPQNYLSLVMVNGRMEGLLARDYADRFPEARAALTGWIRSGQLKSKEDVEVGLERAPAAWRGCTRERTLASSC